MWPNIERSGSTFKAKPCMDRPVDPHPTAQSLRGAGPWGPSRRRDSPQADGAAEPEITDCVDHELLDGVDGAGTARSHRDIEDRIADELARTVIGDIATAVGVDKLCTDGLRIGKDVLGLGAHAEGVHMRVLEQEQVLRATRFAQSSLEDIGVPVPDAAEPPDAQLPSTRAQSSASQSRDSMTRASSCRNPDALCSRRRRGGRRRARAGRSNGCRRPRSVGRGDHDRPALDPVGREDRHLRLVDDRRGQERTNGPGFVIVKVSSATSSATACVCGRVRRDRQWRGQARGATVPRRGERRAR